MSSSSIAVPLYIYPDHDSWEPLHSAISAFPAARFNIIINPNNGPGGIVPDSNYIKEVARLNASSNVTLFGYVHVSWGNRDLALVTHDITDWSRWQEYTPADLRVDGIFVDEAPSSVSKLNYMSNVYKHTKSAIGHHASVWINPGVVVNHAFYAYADLVNSHENTQAGWKQQHDGGQVDRKSTTMIHSWDGSTHDLLEDVRKLRRQGYCSILITTETCYTSFSKHLPELVQVISCPDRG